MGCIPILAKSMIRDIVPMENAKTAASSRVMAENCGVGFIRNRSGTAPPISLDAWNIKIQVLSSSVEEFELDLGRSF